MSLTKKVYLTISGYDIKLSDNLTFYQKDQLKLIFYINEYGIDYENNATARALMPVNPLNAILFIENPDGVDSVSSAKIEDNAVTFYLDSTHTQYVGISRMQLRLFDQDGCAITLPHFTFEIRENIYGSGDVRFQNVVMVDQTGTVILTEDNDLLDVGDILTMGTEVAYPQVTKTIKELPIKHGLDGTEKLIVEDNEATKQAPLGTIVDEIKQNSQEKIREIESELAQTNAQLSENANMLIGNMNLTNIFKSKYIALTFTAKSIDDSNTFLKIITSNDGVNWDEYPLDYESPSLRDPIMFEKNGKYYITGTNLITQSDVRYLVTENFLDFSVEVAGNSNLSDYNLIWAPDVFKVGNDYYMTASLSRGEISGLNVYVSKLDSNLAPTLWTKLEGQIPAWCYDGHIIPTKDKYYLVLKDSSEVKGIRVYESTELASGYKRLVHLDYDDKQEAPYLIQLEDGTIRLYVDTYEGEGQISFKDSTDGGVNWSTLKPIRIDTGLKAKHLHVYDLGGYDWRYHFSFNPNLNFLTSIDDQMACENRLFGETTNGTFPEILASADKWGYITNVSTGGNNYIQTMTCLSKRKFIRNCINGVWGEWSVILDSNDAIDYEIDIPLSQTCVVSGYCRLNALSTLYRRKNICIQANFKLKTGTTGLVKIGTIPENYRSRAWILGDAFTNKNIDENAIKWELSPNGDLNLLISSESNITSDMDVTVNINYICN